MLKSSKLLSVIVPNFNHGNWLKQRVLSILAALPEEGELILIDDCSTDNSRKLIKKLEGCDSRLKTLYHFHNQGVNQAVATALKEARGQYVSFLSVDDQILPQFFDNTLALLINNPTLPLCCSDCGFIFDRYQIRNKAITMSFRLLDRKEPLICSGEEVISLCRDDHFWVPGLTTIVKRELVEEYGGLNSKLGPKSDWFLLHAIALEHGLAYLPQTLSFWRSSPTSYSAQLLDPIKRENWRTEMMNILNMQPALLEKFHRSQLLINRF